jgi:hypothetical protein
LFESVCTEFVAQEKWYVQLSVVQERDGKYLSNLNRIDEGKRLLGRSKYREEGKIEK